MANLDTLISTLLTDLDGADTPQQVYAVVADSVTLAQLVTAVQGYQTVLDPVTDAVITEVTIRITIPLVGGLKTVAGPNPIIKGMLANAVLTATPQRSYGQITPAWAQAKISGGKVLFPDTQVSAYLNVWNLAPITNLGALRSNHWDALNKFRRTKLADRSVEREYNSISLEEVP